MIGFFAEDSIVKSLRISSIVIVDFGKSDEHQMPLDDNDREVLCGWRFCNAVFAWVFETGELRINTIVHRERINGSTATTFYLNVCIYETCLEEEFVIDFTAKFLHRQREKQ